MDEEFTSREVLKRLVEERNGDKRGSNGLVVVGWTRKEFLVGAPPRWISSGSSVDKWWVGSRWWVNGWRRGNRSFRPFGPTVVEVVGHDCHQRDRVSESVSRPIPSRPSPPPLQPLISFHNMEMEQTHYDITFHQPSDTGVILRGVICPTNVKRLVNTTHSSWEQWRVTTGFSGTANLVGTLDENARESHFRGHWKTRLLLPPLSVIGFRLGGRKSAAVE